MSDNVLQYEVCEKGPDGRLATRKIEKLGPTGLITTSTRPLPNQMNTRTLELLVRDDPAQTRAVMLAHAAAVNPDPGRDTFDASPFLALQDWLGEYGERRVIVPFARALAELAPDRAVRWRRDFKQLLTLVQTAAFVSQSQRDRSADGAVIATLEDYEAARGLLEPVFGAAVSDGVTAEIRATVEAVRPDEQGVSVSELARRLKCAKSTISERLEHILKHHWLINEEARERQGFPAKLRRGEPLPDARAALPTVTQLRAAVGRSGSVRPRRRTLKAHISK